MIKTKVCKSVREKVDKIAGRWEALSYEERVEKFKAIQLMFPKYNHNSISNFEKFSKYVKTVSLIKTTQYIYYVVDNLS